MLSRSWLRRLYEALYPAHVNLGSLHVLSTDLVPELQQGRQIVTVWLRDFLNTIDPWEKPTKPFLVNLMRTTCLAMLFDRRAATDNLQRIPCAVGFEKPGFLMRRTFRGEYRYAVHDLIAMMRGEDANALDRGLSFLKYVISQSMYTICS